MVSLLALWMPIVVSAVFVFVALMVIHALLGWHKGDNGAVPGEERFREAMRGLSVPPGDYRFPFGSTTAEMTTPEFEEKMRAGPVGSMTIQPSGSMNMGKLFGQWFVYTLVVGVLVACITGRTHAAGAPFREVFHVSALVAFACYVMALWQDWIWWGKSTRSRITYSLDGLIFALVTGATFAWLWPK